MRALIDRISDSPQFRRAPRTRDLFRYLTTRALENHKEATEYEIASDVFGRKENFDPAESNVVRISMRQLRQKLKEYYDQAGAGERWQLEFPRGGYSPAFSAAPLVPDRLEAPPPRYPASRWRLVSIVLAALLLLSVALHLRPWAGPSGTPPKGEEAPFLASLASGFEGPVRVVGADSAYSIIRQFRPGALSLEQYEAKEFIARVDAKSLGPLERRLWEYLITRQYLNVADVNIGMRAASYLPPRRTVIEMARHLKARDFRHGNFIILGTGTSNPWHILFEDQLNFYYAPPAEGPQRIVNRNPRPGEPAVWSHGNDGESFGIVSMVKNMTGSGQVVLIAGFTMEATEACGDFVLKPEMRPLLLKALGVRSEAELAAFEVLLHTSAVSGTGRGSRIVAVRANRKPA